MLIYVTPSSQGLLHCQPTPASALRRTACALLHQTVLPPAVRWPEAALFHMHLAEQLAEVEEVKQHLGARPVEWVLNNLEIDDSCCFIHCTQMQPHEIQGLAKSGAIAGLCPVTEANLGDGIFAGVRWLDSGGAIAIGSDSNIRISLSEEIRTLEYSQRLRDHSRASLASDDKSTGRRIFDEIVAGAQMPPAAKPARFQLDIGLIFWQWIAMPLISPAMRMTQFSTVLFSLVMIGW